ncbi:hypothetical protein V6N11_072482 [Hibiscus sabdariffa]|uniref:Uncharacterized protein n=1 Tax=Hibiscus sabdariffa TaxID=183260 RepID=A0ABR2U3Q1_9ROSI
MAATAQIDSRPKLTSVKALAETPGDQSWGAGEHDEEEKGEFGGKHVLDPIRYGTSFNASIDKVLCWRDYLKVFQHPELNNPPSFREISLEYGKRVRKVAKDLLRGISESLGVCNGVVGSFRSWPSDPPNPKRNQWTSSASQWEMGQYRPYPQFISSQHRRPCRVRAVVNNRDVRISIAMQHAPAWDAVVSPASKLVGEEGNPPAFRGMEYKEYLELNQSNVLDRKSCLERVRNRVM